MEGRANDDTRMHSKRNAPNYTANEATRSNLKCVAVAAINNIESQVKVGELVIHILLRVCFLEA